MRSKNKKGFSLIELLTIIAIIGIMTAVSLVSLMESKTKKDVEVAAREVASAVREAQNYAISGKGIDSDNDRIFFRTNINSDGTRYGLGSGAMDNQFYYLKNGVHFSSSDNTISFKAPSGELIEDSSPIVLQKGSIYYTICISSTGRIGEMVGNISPCPQ